ncbi:hypothetical protein AB3S75_015413 [Citrus x aurantiifolia]
MAVEGCLPAFSGIVSQGSKALFEPIIYAAHILCVRVPELHRWAKRLSEGAGIYRERVQMLVREATLQGDDIYKGVRDWLNRVAEFSEGVAKSIIDDKDRAKMFCFKGLCPNLISRYKLGKQAAEAANEADKLVKKGEFNI